MDRVCGRFDETGARLVEIEDPQSRVPYILPYRFYLWAWQNPRPKAEIAEVTVCGGERHTVIVGAVTQSIIDEEPLNRSVAREVLTRLSDAEINENVEVRVDRGFARYVYRVNQSGGPNRLGVVGWGAEPNSPHVGYTRIAAAGSATVTILRHGLVLGEFRWGDLVEQGTLSDSNQPTAFHNMGEYYRYLNAGIPNAACRRNRSDDR